MTTTIHIPNELLFVLDRRIKELHISRNKYICTILQKDLANVWPEEFIHKKLTSNKLLTDSVDDLQKMIQAQHINKKGPAW